MDQSLARGMGFPRRGLNRRRRTREGPEPACVRTPFHFGSGTLKGVKDEFTCRGTVQLVWQKPPVSRKGGRTGLPARVSGRHVVRGTDRHHLSLPNSQPCFGGSKGLRQGNRQGWWKRSKFMWNGRQLTLDKTIGSRVWWHTQGSSGRPASDLGWGSSSKTAPGSLSTGSPAGRTPPHGDGSMYSQANVRAGKVLRPPIRALPSVIVDTEKVLREADGPFERWLHGESASGGEVIAPRCASKARRVSRWGARRSQAVTNCYLVWSLTFIIHVNTNSIAMWETLPNNADWDCFKTPILQEILRIQNLHQVEHCAFLEVIHFVPISWMCKKQTSVSNS